jgi:hypothetical protein
MQKSPRQAIPVMATLHNNPKESVSLLQSLRSLQTSKGSRNVLKRLNYETFDIQKVDFLPPTFNGDVVFELPPIKISSVQSQAKLMVGMDKRHDAHAWTKTITSHIKNDMGLTFHTLSYLGHFRCGNQDSNFLKRVHWSSLVNETKWNRCKHTQRSQLKHNRCLAFEFLCHIRLIKSSTELVWQ